MEFKPACTSVGCLSSLLMCLVLLLGRQTGAAAAAATPSLHLPNSCLSFHKITHGGTAVKKVQRMAIDATFRSAGPKHEM